ncbi:MAG: hypothetical protein Q7S61_03880 [bacterium]|nr:hypothetical protein [bacterium]
MKLIKEIFNLILYTFAIFFFAIMFLLVFIISDLKTKIIISSIIVLIILFLIGRWLYQDRKNKRIEYLKYERKWMNNQFDSFLGDELLDLRLDYIKLLKDVNCSKEKYSDYSFVILPMAKVLEGFLKKVLVKLKLIKLSKLKLDPDFSVNSFFQPKEGKINELIKDKRYKTLTSIVYSVYQECRNEILHYDLIGNVKIHSLDDVKFTYKRIEDAIIKTYNVLLAS